MIVKRGNIVIIAVLLILISCKSAPPVKHESEKEVFPEQVEELIMPSGFDNDYAIAIKNNKTVQFVKPFLRIINFKVSDSFLSAIRDPSFKMDEALKSEIAKTGRFTLLGNEEDINAVLKEQNKLGDDAFDASSTNIEMGNLKIAGYILTGEITHVYPKISQIGGHFQLKVSVGVSITVINANTGEIDFTQNITAENEESLFVTADGLIVQGPRNLTNKPLNALNSTGDDINLSPQYHKALTDAIEKIMLLLEEKYPIMGEVVGVSDDIVVTSISEKHGVKTGDYIFIIRTGDPLYDAGGTLLGLSKNVIAAGKVISVEKNMSQVQIIKVKDRDIKPGKMDIAITLPTGIE